MKQLPSNTHAIVEIERPGVTDGQGHVIWDSWQHKRLFENVEVELVTNESSKATWRLFDPSFKVIDAFAGSSPVPMATVRVFLGYGADLGEPVFKGLLAQVERNMKGTKFTAFDMGFKMKLIKKAGYKNKKSDLVILKELTERNGLKFEGPESPLQLEPHKAMMQDEQTDWQHVMERAKDAGMVIFVRQDTLFAKYPAKVGNAVATLRNRNDTRMFDDWEFTFKTPEHQDGRPKVVKHRGRGKGGKRAEGQSDESSRGRESVVLKRDVPGKATKSKLSKRAQAQKELEREHAFEGRISMAHPTDGERIDVRNTISVAGVGKLFSGKYICDRVSYRYDPHSLELELDLYRDISV